MEKITHRELCLLAAKWLKKDLRCTISIHEPKGIKENLDAIGWRYSWGNASNEGSVLVECKTSRADFKKDFSKAFRIEPEQGIGNWRYYMCPTDIIKIDEIPDKWSQGFKENDPMDAIFTIQSIGDDKYQVALVKGKYMRTKTSFTKNQIPFRKVKGDSNTVIKKITEWENKRKTMFNELKHEMSN